MAHGDDTASRLAAVRERLRVLRGAQDKFLAVDFTGELEAAASEAFAADAAGPESGSEERS